MVCVRSDASLAAAETMTGDDDVGLRPLPERMSESDAASGGALSAGGRLTPLAMTWR